MTPEQLKESILQYAIKGKLVEQRPEEGTAEDLLREIAEEKEGLISEGKIPKEKRLAEISEDEKDFVIPNNWRYVRVQDIASYITDYVANGSFATLKKHTTTYKTPNYAIFVRTMDLTAGFIGDCSYIDKESYDFLEKSKLYGGELILPNIGGSIGKAFLMPDLGMPMSLAPNSIMLKFIHPVMNKFFSYIIQSTYGKKFLIDTKGGTATPKFSKTELRNMVVMLPPIGEIERIVSKIEELLPLVDRYAASYEKLEQFNAKFPEDMKKSILQYAIQGKLVEQRPEEGTAEELYQQIQEEKQKLIKEGKIKKEKPLAEVTEDEIPFDIPESWMWVRFDDLAGFYNGDRGKNYPNKSEYVSDGIAWINTGHILPEGFLDEDTMNYITEEKYNSLSGGKIREGDMVYCLRGATFGKVARIEPFSVGAIASSLMGIRPAKKELREYIYLYLKSPLAKQQLSLYENGSAQQNLAAKDVRKYLVPLPPLEEQKRIIEKVNELLPWCERLAQ